MKRVFNVKNIIHGNAEKVKMNVKKIPLVKYKNFA